MKDNIFGVLFLIALFVGVLFIVIDIIKKRKTKANPTTNPNSQNYMVITQPNIDLPKIPFERKYLLTKNEYFFYKELKRIADKYNLAVLSKIRFADLVQVKSSEVDSKSEWYSNFGKIKAKHIDFALADPSNLYVTLIIELDDTSHLSLEAQEKDNFKNMVLEKCGYKIIRTYGTNLLEEQIVNALDLKTNEESQEKNNG